MLLARLLMPDTSLSGRIVVTMRGGGFDNLILDSAARGRDGDGNGRAGGGRPGSGTTARPGSAASAARDEASMSSRQFVKLCRDAALVSAVQDEVACQVIFSIVKPRGALKLMCAPLSAARRAHTPYPWSLPQSAQRATVPHPPAGRVSNCRYPDFLKGLVMAADGNGESLDEAAARVIKLQRPLPPHAFTTYSHLADKGVTKQRTLSEFERAVAHWGRDSMHKMITKHGAFSSLAVVSRACVPPARWPFSSHHSSRPGGPRDRE